MQADFSGNCLKKIRGGECTGPFLKLDSWDSVRSPFVRGQELQHCSSCGIVEDFFVEIVDRCRGRKVPRSNPSGFSTRRTRGQKSLCCFLINRIHAIPPTHGSLVGPEIRSIFERFVSGIPECTLPGSHDYRHRLYRGRNRGGHNAAMSSSSYRLQEVVSDNSYLSLELCRDKRPSSRETECYCNPNSAKPGGP